MVGEEARERSRMGIEVKDMLAGRVCVGCFFLGTVRIVDMEDELKKYNTEAWG